MQKVAERGRKKIKSHQGQIFKNILLNFVHLKNNFRSVYNYFK